MSKKLCKKHWKIIKQVIQNRCQNHQKTIKKSIQKKGRKTEVRAHQARGGLGSGKRNNLPTLHQQDTYRHPTERQQKADNLKEDYQK